MSKWFVFKATQYLRRQNHKSVTVIFRKMWKILTISIKTERVSVMYEVTASRHPQKNYMIDTFLLIRILNPKKMKNFQKIFVFSQKIDIYSDSI